MVKKKTTKVKKDSPLFKATLIVLGRTFTSQGETVMQAIENLVPGNVRGKSILCLERNGKRQERVFPPMITMRLFGQSMGLVRTITLKQAANRFDV